MSRIGVLLVDDHAMLRAGMKLLIGAQPDLEVVGEAGSLRDAVELARKLNPAVVTLDLTMPGGGGIDGVAKVLAASPKSRVLVLTMHDDPAYVRSALALGAAGYIVKSAADTELIGAIRAVARGRVFVDIQHEGGQQIFSTPAPKKQSPFDSLSEREREVLLEVAKGYTNQQIADRVGLSVKTIESYRARLMQKLGLKDRADLMRLAVEAGLLKSSDVG